MFKKNIVKTLLTVALTTLTLPIATTAMQKNDEIEIETPNTEKDNLNKVEPKISLNNLKKPESNDEKNNKHYTIPPYYIYKLKNVIGKDTNFKKYLFNLKKPYMTYYSVNNSNETHVQNMFNNIDNALEDILLEYDKYVKSRYKWKDTKLKDTEFTYSTNKKEETVNASVLKSFLDIFLKYYIFIYETYEFVDEIYQEIITTIRSSENQKISNIINSISEKTHKTLKNKNEINKELINKISTKIKKLINVTDNFKYKDTQLQDIINDVKKSIQEQFIKIFKIINSDDNTSYEEYENILNPIYCEAFFKKITARNDYQAFKNNFLLHSPTQTEETKIIKEFLKNNSNICKDYIVWYLRQSKKDDALDMMDKLSDYIKNHREGEYTEDSIVSSTTNLINSIKSFNAIS